MSGTLLMLVGVTRHACQKLRKPHPVLCVSWGVVQQQFKAVDKTSGCTKPYAVY